jgi:hypothetical protein
MVEAEVREPRRVVQPERPAGGAIHDALLLIERELARHRVIVWSERATRRHGDGAPRRR